MSSPASTWWSISHQRRLAGGAATGFWNQGSGRWILDDRSGNARSFAEDTDPKAILQKLASFW